MYKIFIKKRRRYVYISDVFVRLNARKKFRYVFSKLKQKNGKYKYRFGRESKYNTEIDRYVVEIQMEFSNKFERQALKVWKLQRVSIQSVEHLIRFY